MGRRALRVGYDGRPFSGFQRQPHAETVEGAVLDALAALDVHDAVRPSGVRDDPPGYAAAGRTDAGVHAAAQTVAFDAPDWLTPRALNARLPESVRAWASADAPPDFHATRDAAAREYVYHLPVPPGVDPDAASARAGEVVGALVGETDWRALSAVTDPDRDTVRTVLTADAARDGDVLRLRVRATGFLRESMRRLATLVDGAARGDPPVAVDRALSGASLSGPSGIGPAPPGGLVLTDVAYPDLDGFAVDRRARADLRAVLGGRRRRARSRDRALGTVLDGAGAAADADGGTTPDRSPGRSRGRGSEADDAE